MGRQLYMVVENFKNGNAAPVYQRFRERAPGAGRVALRFELGDRQT